MAAPSRRSFLIQSSTLLAGAGLATIPVTQTQAEPAAGKINIALIGCKNMGWANLTSILKLPDVECLALCDVDDSVLNSRAAELEKKTGKKVALYKDFRKLLERKDIQAVIIGTPDHWHALQTMYACEAGKDVYVEKPLANSIEECLAMVAAARKYNRVVQVGQWQRSGPHFDEALTYATSGKLGKIRTVKAWAYMGYGKEFPPVPDEPVPAGVDYKMWLGPAPDRPFNKNRFHGSFRYFWDYAGGLMTDWGVHMIDMGLKGMKVSTPKSVQSLGGKLGFPEHADETPDTMQTVYEFDGFTLLWEQAKGIARGPYDRDHGVAFIGNLGTMVADRSKWEVFPEVENGKYLTDMMPPHPVQGNTLDLHTKNFVDCIKSRQKPNGDVEIGAHTAICAQLGNISHRLGRKIFWDSAKNVIVNDPKAEEMAKAHYHNGWQLPKV
ncbi:Gfo/Idh/MocA family oxidoreductase [Rhodocytophaga rosea]|uniref:Gfo/Idh/MocA family oxidoreductase n=1 Tax=Rhodocytophaga rosea TaxID=2704465 RepID=A0A6C0GCU5_9BACT|nr:Gfo/Idh/MocA family oxidoreductase [Rhodocytophaga rosea]QHT65791.1 Gfo/Idh/MocA family oxidoreductase [Rhodocytophaga rosea]